MKKYNVTNAGEDYEDKDGPFIKVEDLSEVKNILRSWLEIAELIPDDIREEIARLKKNCVTDLAKDTQLLLDQMEG